MTTLSTRMLAKIADAAVSLARKLEGRSRLERAELLTGCFFLVVLLLMARRRRTKTAPEAARPEPGAPAKGRSLQPGGAEDGPCAAPLEAQAACTIGHARGAGTPACGSGGPKVHMGGPPPSCVPQRTSRPLAGSWR